MSEFYRDEKREEQRDKDFENCKQQVMKDVKIATNDSLIDDDDVMNGDSAEDELMNDNIIDDDLNDDDYMEGDSADDDFIEDDSVDDDFGW